jgi:hypothetical protein
VNIALLVWGAIFSMLGFVFFVYGKKQTLIVPMICGMALMLYPYIVSSAVWMVLIGVVLSAIPYFIRE